MRVINQHHATEPIDAVRPHPRNPRQGDVGAIHESITANGFYGAIIAQKSTGYILAGNHRWQAAQAAGATEIPVTWVDVDDDHALRILLADNRTNDLASYNDEALAEILKDLHAETGTLLGTGYDGDDLDELLADLGLEAEQQVAPDAQVDRADELREKWQTEVGQLWVIGRHRLLCGDSTNPEHINRLMDGRKANAVFTDPPYALFGNSTGVVEVTDDKMIRPFFRAVLKGLRENTEPFGHIYICCDWHSASVIQFVANEVGLRSKNLCVWDKGDGGLGNMYQMCHELVWFYSNTPHRTQTMKSKGSGGERTVHGVGNIWRVKRTNPNGRHHNAEKPVDLIGIPLRASTDEGQVILDLFIGSGSTIAASENLGRTCYGMEIEPKYVAVTLERLSDMGLKPELAT